MFEFLDLLAMIYPMLYLTLAHFKKQCMGLVENTNHFTTCIDKFLDHISNHKHLDNHMLFYVVFANHNSTYLVIINGTLC